MEKEAILWGRDSNRKNINVANLFRDRTVVIATKHGKERVIGPLLSLHLGVKTMLPQHLDTDQFGTFSGEKERELDPLAAARAKATLAMQLTGCDLVIANEGSFGSHPHHFALPSDEEWVLLMDRKNQLEVASSHRSLLTNFAGRWIATHDELFAFARKAGFPSHRLILKNDRNRPVQIYKEIGCWNQLEKHFECLLGQFGRAFVETDMRALFNPTRMKVIGKTTQQLLSQLYSHCPQCRFPGFKVVEIQQGLSCQQCAMPTTQSLYYVYRCQHCRHTERFRNPSAILANPAYCNWCNP